MNRLNQNDKHTLQLNGLKSNQLGKLVTEKKLIIIKAIPTIINLNMFYIEPLLFVPCDNLVRRHIVDLLNHPLR